MALRPESVELQDQGVAIRWEDGHQSLYPHKYLRLRCRCARCIEEWSGRPLLDPESVPDDIQALDWIMVGQYAIQFLWSDLHDTGIYPFEMLRQICPCERCLSQKSPGAS